MKRLVTIILLAIFQVVAFAQRGKVRPEWDFNGGGSHHNIDDDLWLFLLFVSIIFVVLIIATIKGHNQKNKSKQNNIPSKTSEVIGKIGDVYNTIVGGGCLIGMIIAPIVFLMILVKDCGNDSSKRSKGKAEQRKEKTIVNTIYSDPNYKQLHIASIDEFTGSDTAFYYRSYVFQNKAGRTLAMYSVEYCIDGTRTTKIIKTISPNTYFDTGLLTIIPFQKPPQSLDILIPSGHSRWARSQRTKAKRKEFFLDYLDNALKMQNK